MRDLASPVAAFLREQCEVGASYAIPVDDLYAAYKRYAEDNGHQQKSKAVFGRDLRAANAAITRLRPRDDQDRYYQYRGIRLRT
jgi:putative DNA primase/helicase